MNARIILSINLLVLALILLIVPMNKALSGQLSPQELLNFSSANNTAASVDKVAQYIGNQASDIQFIDVRDKSEFVSSNLPGALNIPYAELTKKEWQGYLQQEGKTIILYSNDNTISRLAQALLISQGYPNIQTLEGGLNEWFSKIMEGETKRGKLTARENAMYGNRLKARKLFVEINSIPDSLKQTFLEAKLLEEEQLDGGCE